jgi:hypothetical protein
MSVNPSNLRFYGSANMPDVDGSTTGGAIDFAKKIFFYDISSTGTMNYVSSSASDTAATIALTGRDGTGVIQTETKTLTGTTVVTGSQSFERLLKGVAGGTTAVGDIAAISNTKVISAHTAVAAASTSGTVGPYMDLQTGDGASVAIGQIIRITNNLPVGVNFQLRQIIAINPDGSHADRVAVNRDWGTIPTSSSTYDIHQGIIFDLSPNLITQVRRPFYNAASDVPGGSTRTYYEKIFAVNDNTATALTVASVLKQTDPGSGTLQFALTNSLNDSATVANRQTAPVSGITSFSAGSAPQTINVPSPQNLPSGAAPNSAGAQGVWLSFQLTAGLAPAKTSFTMRATGQTT